jgi:hypothetical protein
VLFALEDQRCRADSYCQPGEPRKASQRHTRRAAPVAVRIAPTWRPGDNVRWKDRAGVFRRDVGDGEHAEILVGERIYLVRTKELA